MFRIRVPASAPEYVSLLPNPELGNTQAPTSTVTIMRGLSGEVYSYVRRNSERNFTYDFVLTRMKAIELYEIYRDYAGVRWDILDHNGRHIVGYVKTSPLTLNMTGRGRNGLDTVAVSLEIQGRIL